MLARDETSGVNTHFSELPPSAEGITSNDPASAMGPRASDRLQIPPEMNEGQRIRVCTALGPDVAFC
jgi:hypothetical protein